MNRIMKFTTNLTTTNSENAQVQAKRPNSRLSPRSNTHRRREESQSVRSGHASRQHWGFGPRSLSSRVFGPYLVSLRTHHEPRHIRGESRGPR